MFFSDLVSEVVSEGVFQRHVSEVVSGARFPGYKFKTSPIYINIFAVVPVGQADVAGRHLRGRA